MKCFVPVLFALTTPLLMSGIINATPVRQADSFSFPFSAQQLPHIVHKPGQDEMASESSGLWTVEAISLSQPLIITSGRHQASPSLIFRSERIKLFRDSSLQGVNLGRVDKTTSLVEIHDSAFIELAINGTALCPTPQRQTVPELAQIVLYSGKLVWNGCGQVYWPDHIQPQRNGQSWQLTTMPAGMPAGSASVKKRSTTNSATTALTPATGHTTQTDAPSDHVVATIIGVVIITVFIGLTAYCRYRYFPETSCDGTIMPANTNPRLIHTAQTEL